MTAAVRNAGWPMMITAERMKIAAKSRRGVGDALVKHRIENDMIMDYVMNGEMDSE